MPNTITMGDVSLPAPAFEQADALGRFHVLVLEWIHVRALQDPNGRAFNRSYATGSASAGAAEAARMATNLSTLANVMFEGALFSFRASASQPAINPTAPSSVSQQPRDHQSRRHHDHVSGRRRGQRFRVAAARFVIGHYARMNVLVRLPADHPTYFSWSWTHTGSGDHASTKGHAEQHTAGLRPSGCHRMAWRQSARDRQPGSEQYVALLGGKSPDYQNAPPFPSVRVEFHADAPGA